MREAVRPREPVSPEYTVPSEGARRSKEIARRAKEIGRASLYLTSVVNAAFPWCAAASPALFDLHSP